MSAALPIRSASSSSKVIVGSLAATSRVEIFAVREVFPPGRIQRSRILEPDTLITTDPLSRYLPKLSM